MKRILTTELAAHAGERVLLQGWLHRRRELSRVSFLVLRDRAGLAQVVSSSAASCCRRPSSRSRASPSRTSRRRAGWRCTSRTSACSPSRPSAPPVELHRPEPRESLPRASRRGAGRASPSGRARALPSRGTRGRGVPQHARRARLHRDPDAEDRRDRDRGRREPLPRRLLRAGRVPRAEPAVLQADDGRRLRARLRGRPGLPRRAARDGTASRRVRVARRRARLHRRPPRRDGRRASSRRRDDRSGRRASARRCPRRPLRGRAHRRRARPLTGGRAPHLRGARRARLRRGLPDVEAAVLHASGPGAAGVVARLRPPLPRARDRDRRPAPASVRGLPRGARRARAWTRRRSRRTSTRSATACRRTAASPSASSASWPRRSASSNVRETTLFPRDRNRLVP